MQRSFTLQLPWHPLADGVPDQTRGRRSVRSFCFVIASTHRGKGVASKLLNTACNKFTEKGLEYAEAYPVKNPPSAAYNFPGPLSMYLKSGFTTHRDAEWYLVVRKRLEAVGRAVK